jgi:hypothetical protein
MKKLKLLSLFGAGLVIGIIAGGWLAAHLYSRLFISKQVEVAFQAAVEANWLALLRLNESQAVINQMENQMGIQVFTLRQWSEVEPPDLKTRQWRDRNLVSVKTYYLSYPIAGENAAEINGLLASVPAREAGGTCKSGVCQLDDLRLSKLGSKTNSP